jgi:hypothetical protein
MPPADRYIIYVGDLTVHLLPDGRVELSSERTTQMSKREARAVAKGYRNAGKRIIIRRATEDEVAWLRGGRRMGSDWRAYS